MIGYVRFGGSLNLKVATFSVHYLSHPGKSIYQSINQQGSPSVAQFLKTKLFMSAKEAKKKHT